MVMMRSIPRFLEECDTAYWKPALLSCRANVLQGEVRIALLPYCVIALLGGERNARMRE
jgi:hypothetical protein